MSKLCVRMYRVPSSRVCPAVNSFTKKQGSSKPWRISSPYRLISGNRSANRWKTAVRISFIVTIVMASLLPWRPAVHDVVPQFQHSPFKVSRPFFFDLFHGDGHHESTRDPTIFWSYIHSPFSFGIINKSFPFPVTRDK